MLDQEYYYIDALRKNLRTNHLGNTEYDGYESHVPKHFLGLPELFERHPTAEWFIIIGDDNFFSFDRLCEAVAPLDPEVHRTLSQVAVSSQTGGKAMPYSIGGGAGIMTSRRTTREASLWTESWWRKLTSGPWTPSHTRDGTGSNDIVWAWFYWHVMNDVNEDVLTPRANVPGIDYAKPLPVWKRRVAEWLPGLVGESPLSILVNSGCGTVEIGADPALKPLCAQYVVLFHSNMTVLRTLIVSIIFFHVYDIFFQISISRATLKDYAANGSLWCGGIDARLRPEHMYPPCPNSALPPSNQRRQWQ